MILQTLENFIPFLQSPYLKNSGDPFLIPFISLGGKSEILMEFISGKSYMPGNLFQDGEIFLIKSS